MITCSYIMIIYDLCRTKRFVMEFVLENKNKSTANYILSILKVQYILKRKLNKKYIIMNLIIILSNKFNNNVSSGKCLTNIFIYHVL